MHRELCRQRLLAINIKIADHTNRLATLTPPDAKIILLQTILLYLKKSEEKLRRELEDIDRAGETPFAELIQAYSRARQRFSGI